MTRDESEQLARNALHKKALPPITEEWPKGIAERSVCFCEDVLVEAVAEAIRSSSQAAFARGLRKGSAAAFESMEEDE